MTDRSLKQSFAEALRAELREAVGPPWRHGYEDGSGRAGGRQGGAILGPNETPVIRGGRDGWGEHVGVLDDDEARLIVLLVNAAPKILALLDIASLAREIPVGCGSYEHTGVIVEIRAALDALDAREPVNA